METFDSTYYERSDMEEEKTISENLEIEVDHFYDWTETDEEEEPWDECVRAKWTIDGANTLAEAAELARGFAEYLQQLHDEGYVLREPVQDDYGFYYKPETS